MRPIILDFDDWQVSAHRHTPLGIVPDISESETWKWENAVLPFDAISWLHEKDYGPDPVVGFNESHYTWTEDVDWALRKTFALPAGFKSADDEAYFAFQQLDCYFDAFLNGHHIGGGRNQFREHLLDVDENLFLTENELIIYIRSARNVTSMIEAAHGQLPAGFDKGRVHSRRCQSLTGWDWTPRLSSVSILRPPEIRPNAAVQLLGTYVLAANAIKATPGQAVVEKAHLTILIDTVSRRRAGGMLAIVIKDADTGETVFENQEQIDLKARAATIKRSVEIPHAKLWWPMGMGAQSLYTVEARLTVTDKLGYEYELEDDSRFGIRTVTVERTKDVHGETFSPAVNGVLVFCRGANWIPTHILQSQATSADYRLLISAAIGAGMNCLRVWGGGQYEPDEFYDLCDELGVLVWQDFMFACAAYPTYREFLDEVEAEAVYQVMRLRNHPCIMLWCGNNENEWLHQTGDLRKGNEQKIIGESIWSHLIRQVVEDYDPSRYYHQSSPYGRTKVDLNDMTSGDRHSWDSWSGWQSSDSYLNDSGRFITEFGFQGLPDKDSISRFAPSADSVNHPEFLHHQKMIEGQERLARYAAAHYQSPVSLDDWVSITQMMQAEISRRAVEHWRRNRFHTSGALIWQLHDAYPAISWSLIDYYRRPKQVYGASRRFFAPVLLSMELMVGGAEAATVAPEHWPYHGLETESLFPVAGGEAVSCRAGAVNIQVRFVIINDTYLDLSGELIVEFLRSESEPVVLDTVNVQVEPNGLHTALTHEIGISLLKDIQRLTVRAHCHLNERSKAQLAAFGQSVREKQKAAFDNGLLNDSWLFQEEAGLSLVQQLVEPKYYEGTIH